jgi:hypothetical protein
MRFLNKWTIDLDKLPGYTDFNEDFTEVIDCALGEMILECDDMRLTSEIKTEFAKVLQRVDKTTNLLPVKYAARFGMGRRYPNYENEFYGNGLPNPRFGKYYGALITEPRLIKNTLFAFSNWVDIDQQKGHPTILVNLAELNGLDLPAYKQFISPGFFDFLVESMSAHYSVEGEAPIDKKDIKALFNRTIYGGKHGGWISKPCLIELVLLRNSEGTEKYRLKNKPKLLKILITRMRSIDGF